MDDGETLQYDPSVYDCLSTLTLDWPSLSFDLLRDHLGAPRSAFPHTLFMVAGTQVGAAGRGGAPGARFGRGAGTACALWEQAGGQPLGQAAVTTKVGGRRMLSAVTGVVRAVAHLAQSAAGLSSGATGRSLGGHALPHMGAGRACPFSAPQASSAKQNYLAVMKVGNLALSKAATARQKSAAKQPQRQEGEGSDSDEDMLEGSDGDSDEGAQSARPYAPPALRLLWAVASLAGDDAALQPSVAGCVLAGHAAATARAPGCCADARPACLWPQPPNGRQWAGRRTLGHHARAPQAASPAALLLALTHLPLTPRASRRGRGGDRAAAHPQGGAHRRHQPRARLPAAAAHRGVLGGHRSSAGEARGGAVTTGAWWPTAGRDGACLPLRVAAGDGCARAPRNRRAGVPPPAPRLPGRCGTSARS